MAKHARSGRAPGQPGAPGVTVKGYRWAKAATESCLIARQSLSLIVRFKSTGLTPPTDGEPLTVGALTKTPSALSRSPNRSAKDSSWESVKLLSTLSAPDIARTTRRSLDRPLNR